MKRADFEAGQMVAYRRKKTGMFYEGVVVPDRDANCRECTSFIHVLTLSGDLHHVDPALIENVDGNTVTHEEP